MTIEELDSVQYDTKGLVPVVAQDANSGQVLMVAWANREALELTLSTGVAHFWSRSRGELWRKGATSGNELREAKLYLDCDRDTVLMRVHPTGPACHTGSTTCFGTESDEPMPGDASEVRRLWTTLRSRAEERPEDSYTVRLLDDTNLRLKKLGEETTELVVALARDNPKESAEEAADLLYHMMAALLGAGVDWSAVESVLAKRRV